MLNALRRGRAAGSPLNIGPRRALDILRVVKAGWHRALANSDVHVGSREVELNGRLMMGMREAVDGKVVRSYKKISVLPGTESRSDNTAAAPDGLTDIAIHLRDIRERRQSHGPHAVIECKRVAGSDSTLCRLYVKEGVDRFQTGKYASGHGLAFMAGYLVAGSAYEAVAGVNAYLRRNSRATEALGPSNVLDAGWTRTSTHMRPANGRLLALHHSFLEFGATT